MRAAQFAGICAECEGHVSIGDMIENRGGEWVHVECPDPFDDSARKPGELICRTCGLIHRGEC